jgi:hypothetical protein
MSKKESKSLLIINTVLACIATAMFIGIVCIEYTKYLKSI